MRCNVAVHDVHENIAWKHAGAAWVPLGTGVDGGVVWTGGGLGALPARRRAWDDEMAMYDTCDRGKWGVRGGRCPGALPAETVFLMASKTCVFRGVERLHSGTPHSRA